MMIQNLALSLSLAVSALAPALAVPSGDSFPKVTLTNGPITVTIYLPDEKFGYYRGTRFDWSGLISHVNYRGHVFYGPWQAEHIPTVHDAVVGPAEEFGMKAPLGFDEARPGEPFYKIGVGALIKPDNNNNYQFWGSYSFAAPPKWIVTHGPTWIEFKQTVNGERGWGYRYVKRLELIKKTPVLVLTHRLENVGTRPIETDQYCHNFTMIDAEPIGPGYEVRFPFWLQLRTPNNMADAATVSEGRISFTKPIVPGQAHYCEFPAPPEPAEFEIKNVALNVSVKAQCSLPAFEYHVYTVTTAVCPEPFLRLSVAPGKHTSWSTRYTFRAPALADGQETKPKTTKR